VSPQADICTKRSKKIVPLHQNSVSQPSNVSLCTASEVVPVNYSQPLVDELLPSTVRSLSTTVLQSERDVYGDALPSAVLLDSVAVNVSDVGKSACFLTALSDDCIESVLGCAIPDGESYEKQLLTSATFSILPRTVSQMRSADKTRSLEKGIWQSVFVKGMKLSNNKCVFGFKRHRVTCCETSRKANKLFYADGRCLVPGCSVTFKLHMINESDVVITYTGNICHPLFGRFSRPIRKGERNELIKEFRYGKKPYAHFIETLAQKPGEEFLAGNFDGVGKSSGVLRNISCESRQYIVLIKLPIRVCQNFKIF